MGRERAQRTQVQFPARYPLEHARKSSTHPSRRNSPPSSAFTHAERFDAVRKQRRKPELQMQQALLELNQVREHLCAEQIALPNQLRQTCQELRIAQSRQPILVAHRSLVTRAISNLTLTPGHSFQRKNACEPDRPRHALASSNLTSTMPQIQLTPHIEPHARRKPVYKNRQHNSASSTAEPARADRANEARFSAHARATLDSTGGVARRSRVRSSAAASARSRQHPESTRQSKSTTPHAPILSTKIDSSTAGAARADRASDARFSVLVADTPPHACANHLRGRTQAAKTQPVELTLPQRPNQEDLRTSTATTGHSRDSTGGVT